MIKVSVIVPVYNTSKYLEKCIDSLINQTLKEIEIIVINDGSTDTSDTIMQKYLSNKKIKYFKRTNHGIGETRNFGIEKASGEYLTFVDSDDYVDTNTYLDAYNYVKKNNLDLLIWNYYQVYEDKNNIQKIDIPYDNITNMKKDSTLLFNINYAPWNKLFKKEIFNKYKFPKCKYEDFAILPYILCEANNIGKLNNYYNYYLIRGKSETTTVDKKIFDILDILDKHYCYFVQEGYLKTSYEEIEYYFVKILTMYIIKQKYQINYKDAIHFINNAYDYLNNHFPNWRKNKYYQKNKIKKIIECNKILSKSYITIYRIFR